MSLMLRVHAYRIGIGIGLVLVGLAAACETFEATPIEQPRDAGADDAAPAADGSTSDGSTSDGGGTVGTRCGVEKVCSGNEPVCCVDNKAEHSCSANCTSNPVQLACDDSTDCLDNRCCGKAGAGALVSTCLRSCPAESFQLCVGRGPCTGGGTCKPYTCFGAEEYRLDIEACSDPGPACTPR